MSYSDPVTQRQGHIVTLWNNITLLWGGFGFDPESPWGNRMWDPSVIHCYQEGIWKSKITHGHVPPPTISCIGEINHDYLYVACGALNNEGTILTNEIYRLDLNTWTWMKLDPKGTRPLKSYASASWTHADKIFIFGGYGEQGEADTLYPETLKCIGPFNNQLVYYDCQENSWNWPTASGIIPSPRTDHTVFYVPEDSKRFFRSLAFLFGGEGTAGSGGLHILDLDRMIWETVGRTYENMWPETRRGHSFTMISEKHAVLFGGIQKGKYLSDCWLLNINVCISQESDEKMWTLCEHHGRHSVRAFHEAVKEPFSKRLWILGGSNDIGDHADHISELAFCSDQKLKMLALESVAKNFDKLASNEIRELPPELELAVEDRVQRKHVIS